MHTFYRVKCTKVLSNYEIVADVFFGVHNIQLTNQVLKFIQPIEIEPKQTMTVTIIKGNEGHWLCEALFPNKV